MKICDMKEKRERERERKEKAISKQAELVSPNKKSYFMLYEFSDQEWEQFVTWVQKLVPQRQYFHTITGWSHT